MSPAIEQTLSPVEPTSDYRRARRLIHLLTLAFLASTLTDVSIGNSFAAFGFSVVLKHPEGLRWLALGFGLFLGYRFWIESRLCDARYMASRVGVIDVSTTMMIAASGIALSLCDILQHLDSHTQAAVVLGNSTAMLFAFLTVLYLQTKHSFSRPSTKPVVAFLVVTILSIAGAVLQTHLTMLTLQASVISACCTAGLMFAFWQARVLRRRLIEDRFAVGDGAQHG